MSIEKMRAARVEKMRSLAKNCGGIAVAKVIIEDDDAHGLNEAEFTEMVTLAALRSSSKDRPDVAFAKAFSANTADGLALRKALAIVKAGATLDIEPTFVGGADVADVNDDRSKAYQQLVDMAAELRRRSSTPLSEAQSFDRVFSDPSNKELAARAARRPVPTTMYPHPL
jgi:hypothetical protein